MQSYTQKHLIMRTLQLVTFILLVTGVALSFHLYYIIWWLDIPMHFFGGVFIGLLFIYLLIRFNGNTSSARYLMYGVLFVFVIGFFWEVFEFSLDTFITFRAQNILDSLSDICFDLAGGLTAIQYAKRYFVTNPQTAVPDSNLGNTQV